MSKDLYVTFPVIIPSMPAIEYYIIPLKFSKKKGDMLYFHNLMKTLEHYRHTIDQPENEPDELILSKIDMEWLISHQMVHYLYSHSNSQYIIETFYTNKSNGRAAPQNRPASTRKKSISNLPNQSASTRKKSNRSIPRNSHLPQSSSSNQPKAAPPLKPTRSERHYGRL
jgi:hypothetical protein